MGMIKIQPDRAFADINDMRVKKIDHEKKMEKIIREQEHVFKGIGLIRDKKNNRDIYGSFNIKRRCAASSTKCQKSTISSGAALEEMARTRSQRGHL